MEVHIFGEKGRDQWYEDANGVRVQTDEDTINKLWRQYIMNPTAKRADADGYCIYKVTDPPMAL